jgi:hypothetical protein
VPRAALVGTLVVLLLGVGGSAAGFASRAAIRTQAAPVCPAARVRHEANERLGDLNGGRWIVTSPRSAGIFAYLWGGSEIDGRVAVYAGGVNPNTGTNEKVMWIVDPARRLREGRLRIVAQRLRVTPTGRVRRSRGSFRLELWEAYSEQTPGHIFPSIIAPPRPGCWRLTVRTPGITTRVIIRALPVPR